jgi:hypothetical protein
MTSSSKLGLKIKIGNEEKDLDDIFLKITDYNSSSNYQAGEAVQLMQNTGIKYIDDTSVKRDLIDRYIGYDSDGYIAANYEADPSRVDVSDLNKITDICGNNLVNLFYQLGTKKKNISSDYKSYTIHNKNKQVTFNMKFLQDVNIHIEAQYSINLIIMKYNSGNIIIINNNSETIELSLTTDIVDIKDVEIEDFDNDRLKFFIGDSEYINIASGLSLMKYTFNKDTV